MRATLFARYKDEEALRMLEEPHARCTRWCKSRRQGSARSLQETRAYVKNLHCAARIRQHSCRLPALAKPARDLRQDSRVAAMNRNANETSTVLNS